MPNVTVHVTQSDIDSARDKYCPFCPIELALMRAKVGTDDKPLYVGFRYIHHNGLLIAELPAVARSFVGDYDTRCGVEPFTFEVDIPQEYLR